MPKTQAKSTNYHLSGVVGSLLFCRKAYPNCVRQTHCHFPPGRRHFFSPQVQLVAQSETESRSPVTALIGQLPDPTLNEDFNFDGSGISSLRSLLSFVEQPIVEHDLNFFSPYLVLAAYPLLVTSS